MGDLRGILGQRLVMKLLGGLRIEGKIELIFPAEFKAGLGQGVIPRLGAGMAFGKIGGMRGDLIGNDPGLHILLVGQTEMLLGSDVTEHGAAEPADHGGADP